MKALGEMTVPEQDEVFRRIMSRLEKAESILVGGLDNPSPGLIHLVPQLAQAIATQSLQLNQIEKMLQEGLAKKMDVVIDEMNQPVSVSILAHDVSEIRKGMQRAILWLAGIGVMALLLVGRAAYNIFPALQNVDKH